MWMLFFTFRSLLYVSVILPLSLPSHLSSFRPPVYCLSYQPIHQWLLFFNKWRWSWPTGGWRIEAEWMQKCLLSLSLFILLCLPYVSIPSLSLFLSLPPLPHPLSLSLPLCLCLRRLLWKLAACWTVRVPLPIAAYANRIINLAPDYVASLTHLHLPALHTLQPLPAYTALALAGQIQRSGCRGEAWGLWYKDVLSAWVHSTHSALRV